ncbi:hypothetical protein ACFO25_08330 [Paenactinomyces guangxiensis]|uniref:Uncharacterized protein n=1 Tax=Paenactinomyces guangxiensis TaxID=1490290 RepID=A0A7W2A7A9_9BACL|nr:hypothetical protein [Paenactinomyces guangxiensis]MBA4492949.1 hypothetical protein [Paenactinomyces guangxiensis]MBH8590202.1 hypothetical protein [Paenactinomyces guangxiensis]
MTQEKREMDERDLIKKEKKIIWSIVFIAFIIAISIVGGVTYIPMK